MDGAVIDYLFPFGVGESAINEHEYADDKQGDAQCCFHKFPFIKGHATGRQTVFFVSAAIPIRRSASVRPKKIPGFPRPRRCFLRFYSSKFVDTPNFCYEG